MSHISNDYQYSCSSWNYGPYCSENPYYVQQIRQANIARPMTSNNKVSAGVFNQHGKRVLREEDKIVTNDVLKERNRQKLFERTNKASDNNKSKRTYRKFNESTQNENPNTINNNSTINYKFHLNYDEWLAVKNKQKVIFNKIKKIKEAEDLKMEKINKNVDQKYKEIANQKYIEWLNKKNKEIRQKKNEQIKQEYIKEQEKYEKEMIKEETMNEWFKRQAKKMEDNFKKQRSDLIRKKNEEMAMQEAKAERAKKAKDQFKLWKIKKDQEIKEKKKNDQLYDDIQKGSKQTNFERAITNGITIGPYTDAGELRKIQRLVAENYPEEEEEENEENDEMNNNNQANNQTSDKNGPVGEEEEENVPEDIDEEQLNQMRQLQEMQNLQELQEQQQEEEEEHVDEQILEAQQSEMEEQGEIEELQDEEENQEELEEKLMQDQEDNDTIKPKLNQSI